ncbi:MAG: MaoC family dehydratase, partial [Sphingomonas sp.]
MATISPAEMTDRVGTETISDWVEVTQAMIDQFA